MENSSVRGCLVCCLACCRYIVRCVFTDGTMKPKPLLLLRAVCQTNCRACYSRRRSSAMPFCLGHVSIKTEPSASRIVSLGWMWKLMNTTLDSNIATVQSSDFDPNGPLPWRVISRTAVVYRHTSPWYVFVFFGAISQVRECVNRGPGFWFVDKITLLLQQVRLTSYSRLDKPPTVGQTNLLQQIRLTSDSR